MSVGAGVATLVVSITVVVIAYVALQYKSADLIRRENVLTGLLEEEKQGGPLSTDLAIAVGFGSCLDILVDGIPLMKSLGIEPPKVAKYHETMETLEQVGEMFAFFLSEGAAAERFIPLPLLDHMVHTAEKVSGARWAAGGNAPVISNRFAREGFTNVYVGAQLSDRFNKLYPTEVKFVGDWMGADDTHLILEYKVGEQWGNYTVTRANRFVVHSDRSNPYIQSLENFEKKVESVDPRLVVVGGLQMLDNFPFKEGDREYRMGALSDVLQKIPPKTLTHFEMASFAEVAMMKSLMDNVFPFVDSLGMNEQELPNIISMFKDGTIIEVADANPRTAVVLDNMRSIYQHYKQHSVRKLTRIHVHTLAFQAIIATHGSQWKNIRAGSASPRSPHTDTCVATTRSIR